jgi:hypothetical protein
MSAIDEEYRWDCVKIEAQTLGREIDSLIVASR